MLKLIWPLHFHLKIWSTSNISIASISILPKKTASVIDVGALSTTTHMYKQCYFHAAAAARCLFINVQTSDFGSDSVCLAVSHRGNGGNKALCAFNSGSCDDNDGCVAAKSKIKIYISANNSEAWCVSDSQREGWIVVAFHFSNRLTIEEWQNERTATIPSHYPSVELCVRVLMIWKYFVRSSYDKHFPASRTNRICAFLLPYTCRSYLTRSHCQHAMLLCVVFFTIIYLFLSQAWLRASWQKHHNLI